MYVTVIFFYSRLCVMATIQFSAPMTVCTISLYVWFMVVLLWHEMNENDIKRPTGNSMIWWFKETYGLWRKIYIKSKKPNHISLKSFLAPWGELSYNCYGMKSICVHHDKCVFVYLICVFKLPHPLNKVGRSRNDWAQSKRDLLNCIQCYTHIGHIKVNVWICARAFREHLKTCLKQSKGIKAGNESN